MSSVILNKIPEWIEPGHILGVGEVIIENVNYQYHILSKEIELKLPGFVGFPKGVFLFISEEVPQEYRPYILGHEIREFIKFYGVPGRCLKALLIELEEVPRDIYKDYLQYRFEFFSKLVKYIT